jgi:DNA-binding XRE family transcriptional regulator
LKFPDVARANCDLILAVAMWQEMPPRSKGKRTSETIAFGRRIRELRSAKGWTQETLAEQADMNPLQVGHLERGANDPKLSTILKLARAFGIRPEELIRGLR